MEKKVAIIVSVSIYNRKGLFVAVHQRIKHLLKVADYDVHAYIISVYKPFYIRLLTKEKKMERPDHVEIDGINYQIIWIQNTFFDYLCVHKLKIGSILDKLQFKKYITLFKNYDLIEGHSCGGYINAIHNKYHIPYLLSWHGTDTHTTPFQSASFMKSAKVMMEGARHNFFVSRALMNISDKITGKAIKTVLYNGKDEQFYKYDDQKRTWLRDKFDVQDKKVVAYVGNLLTIKGVDCLPGIFYNIFKKRDDTVFWVIGNGPLKSSIENDTKNLPIRFWGDVAYKDMPELMNVIDLLVVPSRNEGLSLVSIEALSCGANVVSSNVGGIPEVVGTDYVVNLDEGGFEKAFADKCVGIMGQPQSQKLSDLFEWEHTANIENEVIKSIINKEV